jgi:serine phosphatase RsbU (regulator of sigma subunit)
MEAFATTAERGGAALLRILLVEDDAGDAFLVQELLADVEHPVELTWVESVAQAEGKLAGQDCVLVDLGLPDATGLQAVQRLRVLGTPVVVLTGLADEDQAIAAVTAGAQDYLVKGQVDGPLLTRVLRYAVERARSEDVQRQLREAQLHAREKARLERGLLPSPVLTDESMEFVPRYRPGMRQMLLGGDFYDVVQTADGAVHTVIGDVCGHGPDEAALGVCLRVAWRTMMLAGRPADEALETMQKVLVHERYLDGLFATVCMFSVAPDRRSGELRLAGHPPPLRLGPGGASQLTAPVGLPLGIRDRGKWPAAQIELGETWSVLFYTDGIIEAKIGAGPERFGVDGLTELFSAVLAEDPAWREHPLAVIDTVMARVESLTDEDLLDDVAVLMLRRKDEDTHG